MQTRSTAKKTRTAPYEQISEEQKRPVLPELQEAIQLEKTSFARSLYRDLACDSVINNFLKKSRSYSITQRRWKLPHSYTKLVNSDTYAPMRSVVSSIVRHFWPAAVARGLRQVVDTHATDIQHDDAEFSSHTSRPSISIIAQGPSFQFSQTRPGSIPAKIGFSNMASCIELQGDGEEMPVESQLARAAINARQIFLHQPNRRFVRTLAITGHHLRLFHFDRSGAQYTPPLNIHDDPHTFVRLIIGITSPNESEIGLDTSIQWTIENGRKTSGKLTTIGADRGKAVYSLLDVEPFFSRCDILGRGTICWRVAHPENGEELLIKDSWRSEDRISEYVHLQEAVGTPGVVQMLSCESDRGQTRSLRAFGTRVPTGFANRIETRVVLRCYGNPVVVFTSAKKVLYALRDAIAGHRRLFKKGLLHRDVSAQNVLFGQPGAEEGDRGVLIDLDMSTRQGDSGIHPVTDWTIGTILYQSVMVISSRSASVPLPHDHLDDLESFFYILAHIVYGHDRHGSLHKLSSDMALWESESGDIGPLKEYILFKPYLPKAVSSRWPASVLGVFYGFRKFIWSIVSEKVALLDEEPEDRVETLKSWRLSAEEHYDLVLRIFDEGIAALEKEEAEPCSSSQPQEGPSPRPALVKRNPLKRPSDDNPEILPPAKRATPRITRNVPNSRSPTPHTNPRSA
ncbi:hypothetical protein MD484_g6303, partial [Candolleomyces efflorescens]